MHNILLYNYKEVLIIGRMFINLIKDIKDKVDIHRCPLQKKILTCYLKHIYRYTSLERLWNVLFGKHYFFLAWSNCKPNGASQFKMDDVSFSKLITYEIWLHK